MKTHEFEKKTTRRGALGLIGGFVALAIGTAPVLHERAQLDVDLNVVESSDAEIDLGELPTDDANAGYIDMVEVELKNHGETFVPLFFTWDQKRKTRHNWEIEDGPVPIKNGERARYRIVAPGDPGRIHAGYPVQLTVFEKGSQRWKSIQFTPESGVVG